MLADDRSYARMATMRGVGLAQVNTINGAYVNFEETETGSVEVGKAADLIVLDRNLFEIPAHEIHRAQVLLTLLEGKEVYRSESFPDGK